jgi:hypothetical protein
MRHQFAAIGVFAFALITASCSPAPPSVSATAPDTREEGWNQDYETKDASKLLALYADDATLMEPWMAPLHGKAAIQKSLTEMLKDPSLRYSSKSRGSRWRRAVRPRLRKAPTT